MSWSVDRALSMLYWVLLWMWLLKITILLKSERKIYRFFELIIFIVITVTVINICTDKNRVSKQVIEILKKLDPAGHSIECIG